MFGKKFITLALAFGRNTNPWKHECCVFSPLATTCVCCCVCMCFERTFFVYTIEKLICFVMCHEFDRKKLGGTFVVWECAHHLTSSQPQATTSHSFKS